MAPKAATAATFVCLRSVDPKSVHTGLHTLWYSRVYASSWKEIIRKIGEAHLGSPLHGTSWKHREDELLM